MNNKNVKQVIVWRNDLNVTKGEMAIQIANASLNCLLSFFTKEEIWQDDTFPSIGTRYSLEFDNDSMIDLWLNGKLTKVCVCIENEKELLKLYGKIRKNKPEIPCILMADNTCIGIGPYWDNEIDELVKDLKIL